MSGSTVSLVWTAALTTVARRVSSLVRRVAFWTAALLPFVYLPFVAIDPARLADFRLLGAFVSVNLVALVVGHGHHATEDGGEESTG